MRLLVPVLTVLVVLMVGCGGGPDPCLWIVTNNIGDVETHATPTSLHLRAEGEDWGENVMGEVESLPFGESFSFLLGPGAPTVDLRAVDGDGTTWSRFAENSCTDGGRHETILTEEDLDVPCPWTVTNGVGDPGINYALLDVWVRVSGTTDWGPTLIDSAIPYGDRVELTVDVGEAPVEEPPAPCPTDAFEGNDEANPMALTVGTYTDLVVCDDIDDWYSITLAEGQELTITAMFLDDEGDIDVRVFAPDGAYVTAGTSVSDDEVVTLTAETAGTYAVRVYLFADAAGTDEGNMYDLDILF